MKHRILASFFLMSSLCLCVAAVGQTGDKHETKTAKPSATLAGAASSEGEKRFQVNCGRCHNPPEDIAPAAARAVVRHMRVRAMLTAEDERLILEFLAP
jgi:mono/diheme cytochrome c family protein